VLPSPDEVIPAKKNSRGQHTPIERRIRPDKVQLSDIRFTFVEKFKDLACQDFRVFTRLISQEPTISET
jgi:hypothetical protein